MNLNATSLKRLQGVHPHLVAVVKRAAELSDIPFQISEGIRTLSRQKELYKQGATRTMNSRHIAAPNGLSHAVDVVIIIKGVAVWDFYLYARLSEYFKKAAKEQGHTLEWGGDWKSLKDGPHYQLPWNEYPGIVKAGDKPPAQPSDDELETLVIGMSGQSVLELQNLLIQTGANIRADGQFGTKTQGAVRALQQSCNLKVDGIVGKNTWFALRNTASS